MSLPALILSAAMVGVLPTAAVVASEGVCKDKAIFPAQKRHGTEGKETENDEPGDEEGAMFQLLQTSVELGANKQAEIDRYSQAVVPPETELQLSGSGTFVKAKSEFTGHSRQCPMSQQTCCQDAFCTCPYGSQPVVMNGCYTCRCPDYGCSGTIPMCPVDPAFCTYDVGCGCPSGQVRVAYIVYGSYCFQCAPMSPAYSGAPIYKVNVTYHIHAEQNSKEDANVKETSEEEDEEDKEDEEDQEDEEDEEEEEDEDEDEEKEEKKEKEKKHKEKKEKKEKREKKDKKEKKEKKEGKEEQKEKEQKEKDAVVVNVTTTTTSETTVTRTIIMTLPPVIVSTTTTVATPPAIITTATTITTTMPLLSTAAGVAETTTGEAETLAISTNATPSR